MLTKEFILELRKIRNMFDWSLTPDTGRFAERRATPRLHIRGTLKGSPNIGPFDPIGAVCFVKTNMEFTDDYWVESALSIGLPIPDARNIIAAVNDLTWRTVGEVRKPDPYRMALRTQLIETVGLQVPAVPLQTAKAASSTVGASPELSAS